MLECGSGQHHVFLRHGLQVTQRLQEKISPLWVESFQDSQQTAELFGSGRVELELGTAERRGF